MIKRHELSLIGGLINIGAYVVAKKASQAFLSKKLF